MTPMYVVFDGEKDGWAYAYMKGWKKNDRIEFDFNDAHELDGMTSSAKNEQYVKSFLKPRMEKSGSVLVLIGESTKHLYKYIRWELELALSLKKPIIAVNLNDKRQIDMDRCPAIIRDECVIHISYERDVMRYAMEHWPSGYRSLTLEQKNGGWRYYSDETYKNLGL